VRTLTATRVLSSIRRGSSWPVLVETEAGPRLVKLRGAAQGTGPLVAEVLVALLAEALDLHVPARTLVQLAAGTPSDDRDQELRQLLEASVGVNLGFTMLPHARDASPADLAAVSPSVAAAILWVDRLALNPDRTADNPNLLLSGGALYLIDQGAALRFQYDWPSVTEDAARADGHSGRPHVFGAAARAADWPLWDSLFAARLDRDVLESAVATVPDEFLLPLLSPLSDGAGSPAIVEALRRRRAAYVAFLWKRLQMPRRFAAIDDSVGLLSR
jgi:hypothetical protein